MKKNALTSRLFIVMFSFMLFSCEKSINDTSISSSTNTLVDISDPLLATLNTAVPVHQVFEVDSVGKDIQFFTESPTRSSEQARLKTRMTPSQVLPTGFVAVPNSTITLDVELVRGTHLPTIMVGTYDRGTVMDVDLNEGTNTISTAAGGVIWIVYVNSNSENSQAKITFQSGHHPVPVFIKNKTSLASWQAQLNDYNTSNDVLLIGQRVYMVFNKNLHAAVGTQNSSEILAYADYTFDVEDDLSGLDGSSPLHTRLTIPHLMVHSYNPEGWMYATNFRTGYLGAAGRLAVFSEGIIDHYDNWGVWHEIGHHHQQNPYQFDGLGEVTVNIYSLAVERAMGKTPNRLQRENRWPAALSYLADTSSTKSFNASGLSVWTKLIMFHQLWLAYGDSFYQQLHKMTREDTATYSGNDARLKNFVLKSCISSGYDLTAFFRKWGIPDVLNMYSEIAMLNLPESPIDASTLTD